MKHFLQTLGVDDKASWVQIREGYKQQIKVWHPDRFIDDESLHKKAEEKTKEILYALRRLDELKQDLGSEFDQNISFLQLYAEKTGGGKGAHGRATHEDRSMGYIAESFADWSTVSSSLSDSIHRGVKAIRNSIPPMPMRTRRRTTTILKRTRKIKRFSGTYFLITFGLTLVLSTIGAYNVLQLLPEENQNNDETGLTRTAERELLQMLLKEPAPNYEKNLDATARLKLANKRKSEKRPALINAAMSCKTKQATKLVQQGQNIDVVDSLGHTALIWAAKRNCSATTKLLLERGADPLARSTNGFTALRWAKWYRNTQTIKILHQYKVKQ